MLKIDPAKPYRASLRDKYNDQQWKRRQKNEFAFIQTLSRLFEYSQFVKSRRFFLVLEYLRFWPGSKRKRKIRRLMFTSSIKPRVRRFYVLVVRWTSKKCAKKRDARAELLFCS